jgi:pimeloyl-ACP methyl ester carboxylesterase
MRNDLLKPKKSNDLWKVGLVLGIWMLAITQIVWSWSNSVNVSNNIGSSNTPAIAVDSANTIHLVWSDNTQNYPGNYEIFYKTSSNGGVTWSSEQNLSNTASRSVQPIIAAAGPTAVVVAWVEDGETYARIWNGTTWSISTQLSNTNLTTRRLSVAMNQNGVAIVAWSKSSLEIYGSGGTTDAYFYSRWNGSSWSTAVAGFGRLVAMRGTLAYLATSQRTLLRSNDAGATWGSQIALPDSYIVPDDMEIGNQGKLYLAWFSPNTVRTGIYDGQGFSNAVDVAAWSLPNTQKQLGLAINSSNELAILWTETAVAGGPSAPPYQSTFRVMASQSSNGITWSRPADTIKVNAYASAIAGSQTGRQFYGAWQSPNAAQDDAPDVYITSQNGFATPIPVTPVNTAVPSTPTNTPTTPFLSFTVTRLSDALNGPIYLANTSLSSSTVAGNIITALIKVDRTGSKDIQGKLAIIDSYSGIVYERSTVINFNGTREVSVAFSSQDMAWNTGGIRTPQRSLYVRFQPTSGPVIFSPIVSFRVRPRPVVLVHGWGDTAKSWDSYRNIFLKSLSPDIKSYPIGSINMGGTGNQIGWTTASIDENARSLQEYIANEVKSLERAEKVDIVAHSMGGLISRRYIAHYMNAAIPDVYQLIMLGTPNAGSKTAETVILGTASTGLSGAFLASIGFRYPATLELTPSYLLSFNTVNSEQQGVRFYAVAGNYFCLAKLPLIANPIESDPDDIIVWKDSVFAIPLHKYWTYPGVNTASCAGYHSGMISNATEDGGLEIFNAYVSFLLTGMTPKVAPDLANVVLQAGNPQAAYDSLAAIQFTNIQTGTLRPGGRLQFSRIPEAGDNANFIVVGQPDQMTVSIRDPNGRVITPNTRDLLVQYMQMDKNFLPITTYMISNPIAGVWTTIVDANSQTPTTGSAIASFGRLISDVQLTLPVVSSIPRTHHTIEIKVQFKTRNSRVLGASVHARLIYPGGKTTMINLLDDGKHGDNAPSDGIYGYQFIPTYPGVYSAIITASGINNNTSFNRSAIWAAHVEGAQVFLPLTRR